MGAFSTPPSTRAIEKRINVSINPHISKSRRYSDPFSLYSVKNAGSVDDVNDQPDNRRGRDDETQQMIQAQQKQIDALMEMLQSNQSSNDKSFGVVQSPEPAAASLSPSVTAPLKVMLFIDGTWLYYSLFERENQNCPIIRRYGKGWAYKYIVDWKRLPALLCEALQEQDHGWSSIVPGAAGNGDATSSSTGTVRPMEIVRAMVFTSYKKDTPKTSFRYQMYQDMIQANYDVHLMETVGRGEKCVDIQLAVEMLHYATVPNAYDVALILTGDKDFMPAMIRTRQKGRRVGLVSMRNACNKALFETPNIKDFNPVYIEDYLDDLIKRKNDSIVGGRKRRSYISKFTLMKIVCDFVSKSNLESVNIRDIGRYLQEIQVGDRYVSEEIKESYGGLYQFLVVSDLFLLNQDTEHRSAFWVALSSDHKEKMMEEATRTNLNEFEKRFFEDYQINLGTIERRELMDESAEYQKPNFEKCTVAQLKNYCRINKLKVSGTKADLLARILKSEESTAKESQRLPSGPHHEGGAQDAPKAYIDSLVQEYLQASGGKASSRDVGRYLAANKSSPQSRQHESRQISALQELKQVYGSLKMYLKDSDLFYIDTAGISDDNGNSLQGREYQVAMKSNRDTATGS